MVPHHIICTFSKYTTEYSNDINYCSLVFSYTCQNQSRYLRQVCLTFGFSIDLQYFKKSFLIESSLYYFSLMVLEITHFGGCLFRHIFHDNIFLSKDRCSLFRCKVTCVILSRVMLKIQASFPNMMWHYFIVR